MATAWLAVVLWLYMALGETRLLSQPRMAMVAWAALFGLPPAYVRFRALAHAVADEVTAAFSNLVAAGAQLLTICHPTLTHHHLNAPVGARDGAAVASLLDCSA